MRLLVIGGAGYIGSVTTEVLLQRGHSVAILDNFSTGHHGAVPPPADRIPGDLADATGLEKVFTRQRFDAVLHFAAHSLVAESMEQPGRYFENNISGVVNLVNTMLAHGIQRLVFSSTAAVYGMPETVPITEDSPFRPNNPYGASKAIVEQMLPWYAGRGLSYASLRYFNAAGASETNGEDHSPETHLIPIAVEAALGRRAGLDVYGADYPTPDGTAVRDYIHVLDLAEAHAAALERLDQGSLVCNLGNERGYSVREVLNLVKRVTGRDFPVREGPRREGDAPVTVASAGRARELLGWTPSRSLEQMVESAWRWRKDHPDGYEN